MTNKQDPYVGIINPSTLVRPEKLYITKPVKYHDDDADAEDPVKERVRKLYLERHSKMTVNFVNAKMDKWFKFNTFRVKVSDVLHRLNNIIDETDPGRKMSLFVRAFQMAERIRKENPHDKWFQVVGLIHDLGKVLIYYGEPEWALVGDTYPVGVKWSNAIAYGEDGFKDNPDTNNSKYNTETGIYRPNCGVENLLMSWSSSEYLYRAMVRNRVRHMPQEALWMIRYQNFYSFFASNDYKKLARDGDEKIKEAVLKFNKYYHEAKNTAIPDIDSLWPYYEQLIAEYVPWEWAF